MGAHARRAALQPVGEESSDLVVRIEFEATAAQIAGGATLFRGAMRALP
jgi:hypothetical protein